MPLPSIPDYSNCIKTPALVHPEVLNGGHPVEKGVRLIINMLVDFVLFSPMKRQPESMPFDVGMLRFLMPSGEPRL